MKFSHFFIDRPIFAMMMSLLILVIGAISVFDLPVSEYPEVVPPTVVVRATYPGANPKVIADTVASPLEQEINGIEHMLYQSSQSTSDGRMALTVTFALGTDLDKAQVQVQNRVNSALSRLPETVQRLGVVAEKSSPDLTMVVNMVSPEETFDVSYMANYVDLYVKDEISRLPGSGDIVIYGGSEYAMRVWLDPDALASRDLTVGEVVGALREQNQQVAAGTLGTQPMGTENQFQYLLNVRGRLESVEEFRSLVVRVDPGGAITRLGEVARVELGQRDYGIRAQLDTKPSVAIAIFQRPGANAIELSDQVRDVMARISRTFPAGLDFQIAYDPTVFVRQSIDEVISALLAAISLVVIVVIVFLQTWRASVIPLITVPVSLIGTFAAMQWLGLSVNTLSLFGLVLAIGIVVDDAIVVVEDVERRIGNGMSPLDATKAAMQDVTSPIIATSLVLCAVFIPTALIAGMTGLFYKQFALTISIATIISTFNSLTLSPALAALLLKDRKDEPDRLTRLIDAGFGKILFKPFNTLLTRSGRAYEKLIRRLIRYSLTVGLVYIGLVCLVSPLLQAVPGGFIPQQDKQYLVAVMQLPDGASIERTEQVATQLETVALATPGVYQTVAYPGMSLTGMGFSANTGLLFVVLEDFEHRQHPDLSAGAIAAKLNAEYAMIDEAFISIFPAPPVQGLGTVGGFKLQIEDRGSLGFEALFDALSTVVAEGAKRPELVQLYSSFRIQVPQMDINIDREQALIQGVPLQEVFDALQVYLGSLYVNDFNKFGRTYQVTAQADRRFRSDPRQILSLKVRNTAGEMIPLGALLEVVPTTGPENVMHYNGYPTAELTGNPAPGFSSDQAQVAITEVLNANLPEGMVFEWTDVTYQQILAGNSAYYMFPLAVLLVFMVLASQYESLRLPLAIILIVPMGVVSALTGVWLTGGDNNLFTQIAVIVLVALACKNAILIVEFARELQERGRSTVSAILQSCRQRFRPILMTSVSFGAGVLPIVLASGAGAEMRQALGIAVFSGMIGVTVFGLMFTPVFYTLVARSTMNDSVSLTEPAEQSG